MLAAIAAMACGTIGCRRVEQPPPSTTAGVAVDVIPEDDSLPADPPELAVEPEPAEPPASVEQDDASEAAPAEEPAAEPAVVQPEPTATMAKLAPLELDLPAPAFRGTPVPQQEPNVEKPRGAPRPPFLAPEGTANLALGAAVACSDPMPSAGEVDYVTDGDKEASDFGYLEMRPGTQWVQIDLGRRATIYAVLLWHNHAEGHVCRDVVVQVSDDPDFLDAQTVFNNDYDNSSGLGIGSDMGYVETSEGKLIDCRGVEGRYVRLYSRGSHIGDKNHYTEVEVHGITKQ